MKRIKTLFIWAALGLYALVLAELCVRWMEPTPLMPRYITGTPWGVRGNIPGASYRHVTPEVDVGYRINSQGMRADRDFSLAPDMERCRVAMIGDSFFMGYELDLQDTVATKLEIALGSLGHPSEVLNFAVSGLGTAEMLRTYEGRIRQFAPDVVLMQWHSTDIDDNLRSNLYAVEGEGLRKVADSYLPAVELQDKLMHWWLYRFLSDHSQFYSVIRETLATAVKSFLSDQRREGEVLPQQPPQAVLQTPGAELAARLIREMQRQVEADGHAFLAVEIPDYLPGSAPHSAWSRLPAAAVQGVPVLHAGEVFAGSLPAGAQLFFREGHHHLTPESSAALARAVAEALQPQLASGSCGRRREGRNADSP